MCIHIYIYIYIYTLYVFGYTHVIYIDLQRMPVGERRDRGDGYNASRTVTRMQAML